ncbi:hypothetical protein [Methanosarcina sp. UBA5]|uniref:hypothetical protein n=1 Tax=Methanosarcina sp. UBA5 TaxID=1915593 RepID=UPI0025E3D373|nr:hypothetical protein [Methanosarcina sp. UBA5]
MNDKNGHNQIPSIIPFILFDFKFEHDGRKITLDIVLRYASSPTKDYRMPDESIFQQRGININKLCPLNKLYTCLSVYSAFSGFQAKRYSKTRQQSKKINLQKFVY